MHHKQLEVCLCTCIAALRHESGDDPVEHVAREAQREVAVAGELRHVAADAELLEVLGGLRHDVSEELDLQP